MSLRDFQSAVAVVGLGYVGLPLAVAFGKRLSTIGFDISADTVAKCNAGADPARQFGDIKRTLARQAQYAIDAGRLREADFIVVAAQIPADGANIPDFAPLIGGNRRIGTNLMLGGHVDLRIDRSTRSDRADLHTRALNDRAPERLLLKQRQGRESLRNQVEFPQMRAEVGRRALHRSLFILSNLKSRHAAIPLPTDSGESPINDGMGKYITEQSVKQMISLESRIKGTRVNVFGLTFKEDCADIRSTKSMDIVHCRSLTTEDITCKIVKGGCFVDIKSAFANRGRSRPRGLAALRRPGFSDRRKGNPCQ